MKRITTVSKIEETNKIYKATFPEYPECPSFADTNLEDVIFTSPILLCIYIILNNGGEFSYHTQPLKEYMKTDDGSYTTLISCDTDLVNDILNEFNVSADAFYNWAMEYTDKVLKGEETREVIADDEPDEIPEPEPENKEEKSETNKAEDKKPEDKKGIKDKIAENEKIREDLTREFFDDSDEDFEIRPQKPNSKSGNKKKQNNKNNKNNKKN